MANRRVELRVDVVRATLEGLHRVALLGVEPHQATGNRCLARAAHGGCYEKSRIHKKLLKCKITKKRAIGYQYATIIKEFSASSDTMIIVCLFSV